MGGVVNVKVNVKEGYRLQAAGYRELFVYLYGYVYEKRKVKDFGFRIWDWGF